MGKGVDKWAMDVLSAGHLFTDVNQGAVAALVPFLVAERGSRSRRRTRYGV